jgi:hypothetical protein
MMFIEFPPSMASTHSLLTTVWMSNLGARPGLFKAEGGRRKAEGSLLSGALGPLSHEMILA